MKGIAIFHVATVKQAFKFILKGPQITGLLSKVYFCFHFKQGLSQYRSVTYSKTKLSYKNYNCAFNVVINTMNQHGIATFAFCTNIEYART